MTTMIMTTIPVNIIQQQQCYQHIISKVYGRLVQRLEGLDSRPLKATETVSDGQTDGQTDGRMKKIVIAGYISSEWG